MRLTHAVVFAAILGCGDAARAVEPQPFDYWILSLSWSPQYCADKARPDDPQCGARRYGFVVHGLWPQNERGYPQHCPRPAKLPRKLLERMLPLMPSAGLIQHEWNKHGACTGWPANEYFGAIEQARRKVKIPQPYEQPAIYLNTSPAELENQFLLFNPGFAADAIALQCKGRYLREVRLCMDKNFLPRDCGSDVRDRCGPQVVLRPAK